jgi:hypothetical protein
MPRIVDYLNRIENKTRPHKPLHSKPKENEVYMNSLAIVKYSTIDTVSAHRRLMKTNSCGFRSLAFSLLKS